MATFIRTPQRSAAPAEGARLSTHPLLSRHVVGQSAWDPAPEATTADLTPPFVAIPDFAFANIPIFAPPAQSQPPISSPADASEREANEVADSVIRMGDMAGSTLPPPQTAREGHGDGPRMPERRGGTLPDAERRFMESRFGYDFSRVRLRYDGDAARAVRARAWTYGPTIVVGHGEYAPGTARGRRLLAHELAHVIQQGAARSLDTATTRRPLRSTGRMIQRDLAAYQREQVEFQPTYGESMSTIHTTDTADAARLRAALDPLISAAKVGTRTVGDTVIFYNRSATATELEGALVGFTRARDMAAKLLDGHNVWVYSRESLTQMTTLWWTRTLGRRTENVNVQSRRRLTEYERSQATRVLAGSLAMDDIVLDEDPVMSVGGYARTTPWEINFPRGSFGSSGFMKWLIHELTHSWQYQHGVPLRTTLYHAIVADYDYGGEAGLRAAHAAGRTFRSFNTEEQASIVADYWMHLNRGDNVAAWQPFIDQLRKP